MLHDGALDGADVLLKSKVPTDLVQQAQHLPLQLASDQEQTKQLVSDIREALENPKFDEAIQEGLAKAGVSERLQQPEGNNLAGSQHPQAGWGPGSPRSTITFVKTSKDAAADKPLVASAAGDSVVKSSGTSGEGANEIRHQVESLLQRTDSILSRSSGRSSLRRSVSNTLHSLNATSANPSPHAPTPLRPAGGFDFDAALPALETPNMKSTTGSGPRDAAGTTISGGLSLTGNRRRTAAIPFTAGRRPGAQNEYSNSGPVAVGLPSPEVDVPPIGNSNSTFDGLLPLSGDGVGDFTDARRLSEQALSEIGDRFDSHANIDRQNRGFESGSSADRTTVVLDRSASYKINAAQAGAGPYTNFAPLGQLADAVTESVAAAVQGALATAAASAAAAAAGIGARARSSSSDNANGRASGGGMQLPKQQVSNKIALANMLLPEYVESAALAKLKAELASLSNPGPRSHVEGSQFDAVLMALIARLSLWPQVERKSEEMFRKMLNAILDKIFLRLLPSKGGLTQLPAAADYSADGDQSNDSSLSGAVGGLGPGLMGAAGASSSGVGGGGTAAAAAGNGSDQLRRSLSRGKATAAAGPAADSSGRRASDQSRLSAAPPDGAADAVDEAPLPKPSDSMLKAAFAKLAFGQAMLRGGGPMMPVKSTLAASAAAAAASKGAAATAEGTDADTVAGTPDVGMSPALSRTSSIATSVSNAAAQPAGANKSAAAAGPKSQQRVQWSPAVATAPAAAAPAVEASFSLGPAGPRGTQMLQLQHQAQPTPAADAKSSFPSTLRQQPSNRGTYGSPGVPQGQAATTVLRQDVQHPKISTPEKQQRPRPAGSPVESAWLINLPPPWRQPPQQQRVEVTPLSTPPPPPAPEPQPRQKSPGWLDALNDRFSLNAALQSATGSVSPALVRLQAVQQQQQQQYYGAPLQPHPQQQPQQLPQTMDTYRLSVATPYGVSQEQMQGPDMLQTYWGSPVHERCIRRGIAGCDTVSSPGVGVANLFPGGGSSTTGSWVVPSPPLLPQPSAQPLLVQAYQQPAMPTLLPAPQQQQQKPSAVRQQQLARVLTVDAASNSSGSRAASITPPLLQAQQGLTGNSSPVAATGPTYQGGASRSPAATISRTLAAMQHRYDRQDGVRASLFQQTPPLPQQLQQQHSVCEQVQPQQQQSLMQSWLAPDGSLSREASPVHVRQQHSACSVPAESCGGEDYTCLPLSPTRSQAVRQLQYQQNSPIQQHNNPLYVGSATVRVSSPGAKPGSPLKQRVAMPGGCISVYNDAVEVHSSSPLEIKVSPGPAMLSGVAGAGIM